MDVLVKSVLKRITGVLQRVTGALQARYSALQRVTGVLRACCSVLQRIELLLFTSILFINESIIPLFGTQIFDSIARISE